MTFSAIKTFKDIRFELIDATALEGPELNLIAAILTVADAIQDLD